MLGHRDYLGALLNLGIERSVLGDLFVGEKAYVYVQAAMASFICGNLERVKHTNPHGKTSFFRRMRHAAVDKTSVAPHRYNCPLLRLGAHIFTQPPTGKKEETPQGCTTMP